MHVLCEEVLRIHELTTHGTKQLVTDIGKKSIIRFYRYFLRSGLWTWWAKLAYQVMLTINGRLITPFILGSMSVGLNILVRHSFMDL